MSTHKFPLSRDLIVLIWTRKWEEVDGKKYIEDQLYDHLDGLISDLEEEGLPTEICHETTVAALLDVCALSLGRAEASAVVNRLTAKMLNDPELPL